MLENLNHQLADLTGFCYASFSGDPATIIQIVVQQDARRWHRAMMMENAVDAEARERGLTSIKCRVALDLESNNYWKAIGYVPVQTVVSTWLNQCESKSKRPIVVYLKDLGMPLWAVPHNARTDRRGRPVALELEADAARPRSVQ